MIELVTRALMWALVSVGYLFSRVCFRVPSVARPRMKLIALMAAPAYIRRTAVCTEVGGAGR
jgi:hypothetical protein